MPLLPSKSTALCCLILASLAPPASALENQPTLLLEKLQKQIALIQTLETKVVSTAEPREAFAKDFGDKTACSEFEASYDFREQKLWRYAIFTSNPPKASELVSRHAFNGTQYQHFTNDADQMMEVGSKRDVVFLKHSNYILEPFSFLLEESECDLESYLYLPTLDEITNPALWTPLPERCKTLSSTEAINGMKCWLLRVEAGKNPKDKKTYFYKVGLALEHEGLPILLEKQDQEGRRISEFHVKEVGQAPSGLTGKPAIPYAKKFTLSRFDKQNRPMFVVENETVLFKVNQPLADPSFDLDPALAKTIYDQDTGTYLHLPN